MSALLALAFLAAPKTVGITTYTVPPGYEVVADKPTLVNFRKVDKKNWLLFGIYQERAAASRDLAAEFATDWKDLFGATGVAAPASTAGALASGAKTRDGGAMIPNVAWTRLIDVEAGDGKIVSIVIQSGNEAGMTDYKKDIDAVLGSITVPGAKKGATVAVATATAAATSAPVGKPERVPESSFNKGKPRGIFFAMSNLSGKAVCLLFLDGDRITRAVPRHGLDDFRWEQHKQDHTGDVGTWSVSGGTLTITWGDGGVHSGPLNETPNGLKFYGKSYVRPVNVSAAKLAGRWNGALTSGAMTLSHELVIEPNGAYRWESGGGGTFENGRSFGGGFATQTGVMKVDGRLATFTQSDGSTVRHTFLAMPGDPVIVFALGQNIFARE